MTIRNYSDFTIKEILELAEGDLDQAQLASRLARRLTFEVKKRTNAGLSADEQNDLDAVAYVTNNQLKTRRTK